MTEEVHTQSLSRGKSRRERVEHARSRDILDVANELHMELTQSGRDYRWKEHDSMVISPDKNLWKWYSRNQGGDVITLVQTMKEIDFNQAIDYLNDGRFKEFTIVERVQEPFSYYLQPYEQTFVEGRQYLKEKRGLSDETIDFFWEKGVLAQANAKLNDSIEPVVVFKTLSSGEVTGANLQGIKEDWVKWPKRGYAKHIIRNSDSLTGLHVDIGQPKRLVFTESPIDLMSYYELKKDNLTDVRLISMDGLKESTIGRHLAQLQSELSGRPLRWSAEELAEGLQTAIDNGFFTDGKHADWITLAVDNDTGGRNFIDSLKEKGASINEDLPDLLPGQEKADWNDALKNTSVDNSRLGRARRKLDRLNGEFLDNTQAVYDHSAMANGQPMNDKRGGAAYFKKQDQLENKVFGTLAEIKKQEERVERLEQQERFKQQGLNRKGNGLDMSVQNIPRIREELEKADRGEASFGKDTIKRYREELARLEAIEARMTSVTIQPATQALIDEGLVNQWAKQPNLYFVKGLRRVAVELAEDGTFVESSKYRPKTEQEKSVLDELLAKQNDNNVTQDISSAEKAVQPMLPESGSGENSTPPELYVSFDFSENPRVSKEYSSGDIIPYKDFVSVLYNENSWQLVNPERQGYDKTFFALQDEQGNALTSNFRYDLGTEKDVVSSYLSQDFPEVYLALAKAADEPYQRRNPEVVEEIEKPLDHYQEAVISSEQHKKNEINIGVFSEQAQEAAPLPEATESQPLKDLSPSQSESHSLLHFTIENPKKSIYKDNYHPIKPYELNKLNHHAENLQKAAQWYLESLSDTTLHYFYQQESKQYNISIDFEQYHFMHLTGLFPLKKGQTAIKTLHDFAEGKGNYDNIMIANKGAAFQKIKVLPDLKAIMETDSFYFDQVEDILDLHSLSMEQAIKSDDKDILLALSSNEENIYPASLMELTKQLQIQTEQSQHQNVILGVYQERDGEFTQLSINEEYITDNGEEMLVILKGQQASASDEPSHDLTPSPAASIIDAATFTKVLDTAYNVGNPAELGVAIPEEFRATWERYNQLSEESSGDFKTIIAKADELGFLDKTSAFYQDWQQDQIYNETYHVRLKWAESWPDGPQLPFNETELIEYRTFSEELYKQNNAFYALHQESKSKADPVTNEGYIPFTKVKFSVHAPGGELIKEIRYDIGDETKPISQLLGLGYRRLEGQSELAAIDEEVLAQLENYKLNQEIATEANEATLPNQEPLLENDNSTRASFHSPLQEMKANLAQQVKEIVAEELVNNQNNESGQVQKSSQTPTELFDYTSASADEISKHAFQKIREYTQSPEDFMEYVNFMSKFPQLSPRNVALIHEQWRSANAVATYDQWQAMGEALGVKPEDVIQTKATYTNKRTGETKEVVHQGLSVKTGEKSQITLFRPLMVKMIPVLDETGHQVKNDKGNLKYKKLSEATPQEKSLVKEGKLPVREFQQRNSKTGSLLFTTYKVFELSQTTLKPESYPKAMPNRHYNFNTDKVKTKEVLEGLCDYAESIGVKMMKDEAHVLGNAKGAFFPEEQLILINPDNTPGEKIATTIHELAHATLHNSKLDKQYKNDIPKGQKELEAEMTSHLLSKHFGLDTSEKAIHYIAGWTENLTMLDDKQLANSLQRVHKTVSKMLTKIEAHTKPYQPRKNKGQSPNFPKIPTKGPSR